MRRTGPGDPPKITERPRNQAVKAGGTAAFYCDARGDPEPTIVWRKNGKKVSSTQSRYLVQSYPGGSMLRIEPVKQGRDDATYECVAENGVGDAVSAEATLNVYEETFKIGLKLKLPTLVFLLNSPINFPFSSTKYLADSINSGSLDGRQVDGGNWNYVPALIDAGDEAATTTGSRGLLFALSICALYLIK
ncbi:unnamed protein product [Nezara viridula]|uniref:Ig-like domain-containing protein n=1 Tax=Nezara viridula TaxID=85310 RepID=A0A9P0HD26_NEZVI|nr:unnamed protein product [Nezara viridula]